MRGATLLVTLAAALLWSNQVHAAEEKLTEGEPQLIGEFERSAHEGPSWDPKGGWVYFVGRNRVSRINLEGKVEVVLDPSPGANGALVDPQGRVIVCESGGRRVIRIERDRSVTVLADNFEGKKFNSPNDVALDSKGRIYFTDPRYGARTTMEIKDASGRLVEGVYRVDAPGKVTRVLTTEVERPNGILIGPGDKYLYIADNNNGEGGARKLVRFDLKKDGTVAPETKSVIFDWHKARGPDGMKLDTKGNFWVAGGRNAPSRTETVDEFKGGLFVISPKGKLIEFLPLPKDETTNCGFAGPDLKTLYITSGESLYKIRVKVAGRISAK
jgi:gluconolactonase